MNIGERIKYRREELGMSQEELATKLGYKSRSSVNKIENDASGLPQSKIVAIANALRTTPSYIMGWLEDEPEKQAIFEARLLKDEETMNMVKQYLTLDEKNKKAIRQMVETLSAE